MSPKAKAFAKMLSTKIGTRNKKNNGNGCKPVYDNKYLNLLVAQALEMKKMPDGKNNREWCKSMNAPIVDVRKVVHENQKSVSVLRPENLVRQRLETLATIDKRIAKVAYCRYLVNGTADATNPENDDAYKVYLFLE